MQTMYSLQKDFLIAGAASGHMAGRGSGGGRGKERGEETSKMSEAIDL